MKRQIAGSTDHSSMKMFNTSFANAASAQGPASGDRAWNLAGHSHDPKG